MRDRDGEALLQSVADDLDGRRGVDGGATHFAAECASLLGSGLRLRARHASEALRTGTRGWEVDTRAAIRSLRRNPGFTLTVSLAVGVGAGATSVVARLMDDAILTPPPYEDPDALVFIWNTRDGSNDRARISAPDAAELARRGTFLEDLAFVTRPFDGGIEAADGASVEHVRVASASGALFDVLGVEPELGDLSAFRVRATSPRDGGEADLAVLSAGVWERLFGSATDVVGRSVRLDGRPLRVVGVMAPDFRVAVPPDVGMGGAVDVWVSLAVPLSELRRADGRAVDQDSDNTGAAIARLAPGATLERAAGEVERYARDRLASRPVGDAQEVGLTLRPLTTDVTEHLHGALAGLLVAAVGLLLATSLNVSTLALARGARRRGEQALRVSLGAGRVALVRQHAAEAAVLVGVGGVCASGVGAALAGTIGATTPWEIAAGSAAGVSWLALSASVLLCGVAILLFGIVPTLRLGARSGRTSVELRGGRVGTLRGGLVVAQVALSVLLTISTGLLIRSALDLHAQDPGFAPEGAITFSVSARAPGRFDGPAQRARVMRDVAEALQALPGVTAVGLTGSLPLSGARWTQPYGLPDEVEGVWSGKEADFSTVSSGYLAALGVPLLHGRSFLPREDLVEERRVVVIDETLALDIAPEGDPVGSSITIPLDGSVVRAEVVGVVGNVRRERLDADGRGAVYVPYRQEASRDVTFVVRSAAPSATLPAIRDAVREVDGQLPVYGLRPLAQYVDDLLAPTSFAVVLVGSFALVVLASIALGLYGIVALEVSRRTREIGVRIAIGARRSTIVTGLLRRGAALTAAGLAAGVAITAALSGVLRAATPTISVLDPITWVATAGAVTTVALLATWIPARRASRLDPTEALRSD